MTSTKKIAAVIVIAALVPSTAHAQADRPGNIQAADSQLMTLNRFEEVNAIRKCFADNYEAIFAGSQISGVQDLEVFTTPGFERKYTRCEGLGEYSVLKAKYPLARLEAGQSRVSKLLDGVDFTYALGINEAGNILELRVPPSAGETVDVLLGNAAKSLPFLEILEEEFEIEPLAWIDGGTKTYTHACSTGFNVNFQGVPTAIAAGHCGWSLRLNEQKWPETGDYPPNRYLEKYPMSGGSFGYRQLTPPQGDTAIYKPTQGDTFGPYIRGETPGSFIPVVGTMDYGSFNAQTRVCKVGAYTDFTCGKYYRPVEGNRKDGKGGYVKMTQPTFYEFGARLALQGDSGGPVFVILNNNGNTNAIAVGTASAGSNYGTTDPYKDFIYFAPISEVGRLGASVQTTTMR